MYPICTERGSTYVRTGTEAHAKAWLKANINQRVFLELIPDIQYLEGIITTGLLFNKGQTTARATHLSEDEEAAHFILTESGIHRTAIRADGLLAADVGYPRHSYAPEAVHEKRKREPHTRKRKEGV